MGRCQRLSSILARRQFAATCTQSNSSHSLLFLDGTLPQQTCCGSYACDPASDIDRTAGLDQACRRAAGQMLQGIDGKLKPDREWRMEVMDEFQNQLHVLQCREAKLRPPQLAASTIFLASSIASDKSRNVIVCRTWPPSLGTISILQPGFQRAHLESLVLIRSCPLVWRSLS
jgi:hypothetical protein